MKKILLLATAALFLLSFGCATRDYSTQQVEPLVDRVSKLEQEHQTLMKKVQECCDKEVQTKKLEEAADRTEAAAKKSEAAAEKSKKSFEMQLKK